MTNTKFNIPEIDIELDGYDDINGEVIDDRVVMLRKAVIKHIENYGIPQKGIRFWDGNLSVVLYEVLFAFENEKMEVYFSFSVPN